MDFHCIFINLKGYFGNCVVPARDPGRVPQGLGSAVCGLRFSVGDHESHPTHLSEQAEGNRGVTDPSHITVIVTLWTCPHWVSVDSAPGAARARLLPALPPVKLADRAPGPRLLETLRPRVLAKPVRASAGQEWAGSYQVRCRRGRCCRDEGSLHRGTWCWWKNSISRSWCWGWFKYQYQIQLVTCTRFLCDLRNIFFHFDVFSPILVNSSLFRSLSQHLFMPWNSNLWGLLWLLCRHLLNLVTILIVEQKFYLWNE